MAVLTPYSKKGSYPKPFNPDSDKADQFNWDLNDCGTRQTDGETILELPMFIDSTNNNEETYWSKNPASNNNKPGPYRFVHTEIIFFRLRRTDLEQGVLHHQK